MGMVQFSLDSLGDIDGGKIKAMFETHVRRAALDCLDRPADPKPRKVTLEIDLTPVLEPGGDCTQVEGQFFAGSKVPPHRTHPISFGLRKNGILAFNPDSPDDVNQSTLIRDED